MFREDPEFHDAAGASHHGATAETPVEEESISASMKEEAALWTSEAERELRKVPFFVRGKARRGIPRPARPAGPGPSPSTRSTRPRPIMRDEMSPTPYRFVILTLDAHAAGPARRAEALLAAEFLLVVSIHAAAEWERSRDAGGRARGYRAGRCHRREPSVPGRPYQADPLRPSGRARPVDALVGIIADPQIVKLTRMGDLEMGKPDLGLMALMKKLKPSKGSSSESGEKQMAMLRRLPKILRFVPGKAQDLRAWFLSMQY